MKVYLQEEIVFSDINEASTFIAKLPSFSLAQLNPVRISCETTVFQVCVYCFDDEVAVDFLRD